MLKKGILFDFDGVVLKSMEQHFTAWKKAFAVLNIEIKPDDFLPLEGRGVYIISNILGKHYGLSENDISQVIKRKIKYYNDNLHVEFYEGFHELLEYVIQKKIIRGVVTGGNRDRVSEIMNKYFKDVFTALVSVDDTEKGKPYPDPFLKGAELLGLAPEDCLVIENAPMGIEGALKAGMTVIAITTTLKPEYLNGAHYIVNDFGELKHLVQILI